MNAPTTNKTIDEDGHEVLDPRKAMMEATLAVDLARAELDQQIATAHKFPRHLDTVVKKIRTLACYNKDAAENCLYALPRGGKPIIGPSIGFASIVAQNWGNCRVRASITYVDRREKAVIAEGVFFDLETNVGTAVPVTRRIVDSRGRLYSDDMINVTGMAAASIAARNSVLRGVSRGLWHPIWLECLQIVRGDATTFAENKAKAIAAMAQFGVKPEQLYQYLGLKGEVELTLEHIPTVRGMYAALRDGNITVEEMFDPRRMTGRGGFETVENPLGDEEETARPAAAAAPAPAAPEPDPTAGLAEQAEVPTPEPAPPAQPSLPMGGNGQAAIRQAPAAETAPVASAVAQQGLSAPAGLKTAEEYLSYWEGFCEAATTASQVRNQWSVDRKLRERCSVTQQSFAEAREITDRAEARLRK